MLSNSAINAAGDRCRDYKESLQDRSVIRLYRAARARTLEDTFSDVRRSLGDASAQLTCRVKRLDTILRKLRREASMRLVQMDDVIGFRVIVASPRIQVELADSIADQLGNTRSRNYLESPRQGYRAIHLIGKEAVQLVGGGEMREYPYEVQIRTFYQHLWASTSEAFGEQVKEGGGMAEQRHILDQLSSRICEVEERSPDGAQIDSLETRNGPLIVTLHYDKTRKIIISEDYFGSAIEPALRALEYYEDLHAQDAQREAVLIGVGTDVQDLEISHQRYYSSGGFPPLPEQLQPALEAV